MIATCCVAKVSSVSRCLTVLGQISGVERFEWISPFSGLHLLNLSTFTLILFGRFRYWCSPFIPITFENKLRKSYHSSSFSKFIQLEKGSGRTENEKKTAQHTLTSVRDLVRTICWNKLTGSTLFALFFVQLPLCYDLLQLNAIQLWYNRRWTT